MMNFQAYPMWCNVRHKHIILQMIDPLLNFGSQLICHDWTIFIIRSITYSIGSLVGIIAKKFIYIMNLKNSTKC